MKKLRLQTYLPKISSANDFYDVLALPVQGFCNAEGKNVWH